MPVYVQPFGFILMRVMGATLLFWFAGLFVPKQKIELKDFKIITISAFFGVALNMLTFFKGLNYTTPINGAVIMVTTPIIVMLFSFVILKDKITIPKLSGVIIGLIGALILILLSPKKDFNAPNIRWGNFLVFVNAASFSIYLIISKGIIHKYHPVNVTKWMYFIGFLMVLPFGYHEFSEVKWQTITFGIGWKMFYIVVFATFFTYFFNILALKKLKPTTLSVFIYLQPLVASIFAILVNTDKLTSIKIIAGILIFVGVYLVNFRKSTS